MTKICILGLGYIGLPTAAMFATHGLDVIGVDVNERVINTLKLGSVHIQEPELNALFKQAVHTGRLKVSTYVESADAFIIAVPTPFYADKKADMRAVISAAEMIVPYLRPGNLVILESTSPPRTTIDLVKPIIETSGLQVGTDILLAYSPERVLPGRILDELKNNSRVIGGINSESALAGRDLYANFVRGEIVLTDATTAEMVKLMENTYRDVNIAIANEFSRLSDRFGVNVWEAISIANRHPRVNILKPGPGVGGHCISVDPWFLVEAAPDLAHLIRTAREVNDTQPLYVTDLVLNELKRVGGNHVAILGLAYKPDVDDLRESPAVKIAQELIKAGIVVKAFEPNKPDVELASIPTEHNLFATIHDADIILILVAHGQFLALDPEEVAQNSKAKLIIDIVGIIEASNWQNGSLEICKLGVPKIK